MPATDSRPTISRISEMTAAKTGRLTEISEISTLGSLCISLARFIRCQGLYQGAESKAREGVSGVIAAFA